MKQYNLLMQLAEKSDPTHPASVMCCHTVPDDVTFADVNKALSSAFFSSLRHSKASGNTNAMSVITVAMAAVDAQFGGSSYIIQADGGSIILF